MNLVSRLFAKPSALVLAASLFAFAAPARAEVVPLQDSPKLKQLIEQIRTWSQGSVVHVMLRAQNKAHAKLSQGEIDALDKQWKAEREADEQPLIGPAMSNPLSAYLTEVQAHSTGLITEIMVMDSKGLLLGQSAISEDYWQGDEAKFKNSFGAGADGVDFGKPEENAELGTVRQQLSLTIPDPDTGEPAGAVTVEVDLRQLDQRSKL